MGFSCSQLIHIVCINWDIKKEFLSHLIHMVCTKWERVNLLSSLLIQTSMYYLGNKYMLIHSSMY